MGAFSSKGCGMPMANLSRSTRQQFLGKISCGSFPNRREAKGEEFGSGAILRKALLLLTAEPSRVAKREKNGISSRKCTLRLAILYHGISEQGRFFAYVL